MKTALTTLYENSLYAFELEGPTLAFRWTPATAQMSEEDFKDALMNYAGFALEHRPTGLLIDTRRFHFPHDTPGAWRDAHVLPRYLRAGASRMAYVLPEGAGPSLPPPRATGDFREAFFVDEGAARRWLLEASN